MYSTVSITNAVMLAVNKYALNIRGKGLTNKSESWVHFCNEVTFSKCQPITSDDPQSGYLNHRLKHLYQALTELVFTCHT